MFKMRLKEYNTSPNAIEKIIEDSTQIIDLKPKNQNWFRRKLSRYTTIAVCKAYWRYKML